MGPLPAGSEHWVRILPPNLSRMGVGASVEGWDASACLWDASGGEQRGQRLCCMEELSSSGIGKELCSARHMRRDRVGWMFQGKGLVNAYETWYCQWVSHSNPIQS